MALAVTPATRAPERLARVGDPSAKGERAGDAACRAAQTVVVLDNDRGVVMRDHDERSTRLVAQLDAIEAAFNALRFPTEGAALEARINVTKGMRSLRYHLKQAVPEGTSFTFEREEAT